MIGILLDVLQRAGGPLILDIFAARVYSKYPGKGNAFKARWGKMSALLHKLSDTVDVFPDPANVGIDRIPKIAVSLKPDSTGNCAPVNGNFVAARAAKMGGKGVVEADQEGRHAGSGACGTNIHQDIKGTSISLPSSPTPPTPPLSRISFTFKSIASSNDNTANTALHIYTSLPLASPPTPPTPPTPPSPCLISMLLGAPGALVIEAHAGLSEVRHLLPPLLWNGALVWGNSGGVKGHVAGEYRAQDIYRAKVHAVHVTGDDMELMVLVENALARQTEWGVVAWDFSRPVAAAQRRGARGSGAGRVGHGGGWKKGGGDGAPTQHTGGVCEECKGAGGQRLVCALTSSLAGHRWWLDEGLVARELDITRALAQRAGHGSWTAPADTNGGAAGKQPRDWGQGGGRGGAVEEEWAYEVKLAKDARVGACVVWPETKLHRHLLIGRPEPLLVFWRR